MIVNCEQCDKKVDKDKDAYQGYQVFDPTIRRILEMGDARALIFCTEECKEKWKEQNAPLLATSQR